MWGSTEGVMSCGVVLRGRCGERGVLDRLLEAVRWGGSAALVVRGEPGVGKSALLDYLVGRASGFRVVCAAGVQSEMELAFAGLHQLCAPILESAERLPDHQRDALRTALGLSGGPVPDRFLVGLAVLGLFAEAARERPLVCVVDDAQWLDRASAQALAFVARRLGSESVGMVFAVREPDETPELAGLPELMVAGLACEQARALLGAALPGRVKRGRRESLVPGRRTWCHRESLVTGRRMRCRRETLVSLRMTRRRHRAVTRRRHRALTRRRRRAVVAGPGRGPGSARGCVRRSPAGAIRMPA